MNTSSKLNKILSLLVLTAAVGSTAIAADAPAKPGESQRMGWHRMTPEQMQERMAKRQAMMHDALKLTGAQEPAWKTFITATTPQDMGKRRGDWAAMEKMSAPERMEKHLQMSKERDARMTSRLAALKTFYAVLTPEQQQVFNKQTMHHRHHGKGGQQGGEARAKG